LQQLALTYTPMIRTSTLVFNTLIRSSWMTQVPLAKNVWWGIWNVARKRIGGPVETVIHGVRVVTNYGYTYPLNMRLYPRLNNPLVELTVQTSLANHRPVVVVDVGAAIGDTVLLLHSNCSSHVDKYVCIEADPEFCSYFESNLKFLANVTLIRTMLSAGEQSERSLVRTHAGTASSQGSTTTEARSLDRVIRDQVSQKIDVLKIDVDGLDGKVLAGATELLKADQPSVIFEWHPTLYQQTRNDWHQPFECLANCGYDRFIWFTKFGNFSHFSVPGETRNIDKLADLSLRNEHENDWHYDVVALHASSQVDEIRLAELKFARNKRSPY
jgi:FkbM family methyltransferase